MEAVFQNWTRKFFSYVENSGGYELHVLNKSHVFVKHRCPQKQQSQTMAKNSLSPKFDPTPLPGACDVSEVSGTYRSSLVTI